jgi:hypothetical protein
MCPTWQSTVCSRETKGNCHKKKLGSDPQFTEGNQKIKALCFAPIALLSLFQIDRPRSRRGSQENVADRDAAKDIAARDTAKKNIATRASNLYDPWRFPFLLQYASMIWAFEVQQSSAVVSSSTEMQFDGSRMLNDRIS